MPHEIDGEPAFAIYYVRFKFHNARPKDWDPTDRHSSWTEGLPEDRMWNGNSQDYMKRDEVSHEAIITELSEDMRWAFMAKHPDLDAWEVTVTGPRFETWCLHWFNHQTLDIGQSDAEVLASFERFVRRVEHRQYMGEKPPTLMGAEDRWRWRGAKEGDRAPCRCDGCKKSGLIRINH